MFSRPISPEALKAGTAAFAAATAVAALGLVATAGTPDRPAPVAADAPDRSKAAPPAGPAEVQILGVNDFHGHLESPGATPREAGGRAVPLGGAATLDAHLDRAERSHPGRTIRVHAGDMAGATPLISSHFHDEPSIRATNLMDFDVGTVGNHEFDEGGDELLRLLRGGQRNDGKQFKTGANGRRVSTSAADYEGTTYPWTAANTVDSEGRFELPPTKVIERGGVRIGFIGVTTEGTGRFLLAEHGERFRWLDISTVVNRHARDLQRRGVEAIVVLAHSGAFPATGHPDRANGEIIDETRQMTGAVDLVVAGHSQSELNLRVPNRDGAGDKLVVQSLPYGTAFDRVRMTIDRSTGHVLAMSATTPRTWSDEVRADPEQVALRDAYREQLGGLGDRVLGTAETTLKRLPPGPASGNLGTVAARGQRLMAGADIAFVDGGIMRAPVDAGPITYADLFEAHAYEHPVMRMTLTGAEVREVLAQQADPTRSEPLHVSGPAAADIDLSKDYVVAANRLLVDRGGVDVFRRGGREMEAVGTDLAALVAEVARTSTVR